MLLLTTPDYIPKLGGLTTLTLSVEKVLRSLGVSYERYHWKSYLEVYRFSPALLNRYDHILNIHSGFHMYMPQSRARVINFVAGAEILFYSPHPLKHLAKRVMRPHAIRRVEAAHVNIFISDFTFKTLQRKGLTPNYARDIVFPMCVDTTGHRKISKDWNQGPLRFICVARAVPHKNFPGTIRLCERVSELSGRPVELVTVTDREFRSDKIKINSYINPDNQFRDRLLAEAHLNVLLSLDQSHKGFFEGFGQIVQEAACFGTPSVVLGTGGLPESVHDNLTGWVLPDLSDAAIAYWWNQMNKESYDRIADESYRHTVNSHGLDSWKKLFHGMLQL